MVRNKKAEAKKKKKTEMYPKTSDAKPELECTI